MWTDNVCYEKLPVSHDAAGCAREKLSFSNGAIYQELGIPNVDGYYPEIYISNNALRYQETGLKKGGQE